MKLHHIVVTIAAVATLGGVARAADNENSPPARQSLSGPTGLISLPTAYTQKHKAGGVNGNFYQDEIGGTITETVAFSGVYGFTPRVEGGFFYNRRYNQAVAQNSAGGFVKYVLNPEGENQPAFAFGVAGGGGDHSPASAYLVISRLVSKPDTKNLLSLHGGLEYASLRNYPASPTAARSDVQPFGGFELTIAPRTSLVGEVRPKHKYESKTYFSAGLSHVFGKTFTVTAGATNNGLGQGMRPLVMAGFNFALPASR